MDILLLMRQNNIEPKRLKLIYPFENKRSNLVLIEGSKNGNPGLIVEPITIIHNPDGSYKEDIKKLFSGGSYED